ncbi:alpha/beta hydrolase (plasmid) [Agrobacterium tumefaciens]|uniref:alpha/beta fold hydrolase n=1 Tax=Agrobacterium tumefaciens TaxID=358 RepID=UPI001BB7CC9A|nr:alpha/beta hydrolase [Agrobacterium tumefaciens]
MGTTLETADTQHVEAAGIRFAYRKLGPGKGVPLVFLQHFTGTMDAWDPSVVNALAAERPVIVFNNAGVGTSTGKVPDTIEQMSADAESFMAALGLTEVDLLGFSLGGFLAQVMATRSTIKVRKLIVAGSAPRGGEEHLLQVVGEAFSQNARDVRLPLFFTPSDASQAAGTTFVDRATTRSQDRDPESGESVSNPQAAAIIAWCANTDAGHTTLKAIRQPTLIVHGSDDTMFPSINAYEMLKHMRSGTLIIYPDSGHGALFQYPDTFVAHVQTFLNA